MDFLGYSIGVNAMRQRYTNNFKHLSLFWIFVNMSVDGSESGAYNAAHRTRAAALLAADELALGFPEEAGENLA